MEKEPTKKAVNQKVYVSFTFEFDDERVFEHQQSIAGYTDWKEFIMNKEDFKQTGCLEHRREDDRIIAIFGYAVETTVDRSALLDELATVIMQDLLNGWGIGDSEISRASRQTRLLGMAADAQQQDITLEARAIVNSYQ